MDQARYDRGIELNSVCYIAGFVSMLRLLATTQVRPPLRYALQLHRLCGVRSWWVTVCIGRELVSNDDWVEHVFANS